MVEFYTSLWDLKIIVNLNQYLCNIYYIVNIKKFILNMFTVGVIHLMACLMF